MGADSLVTKLQLGRALVLEALLPPGIHRGRGAQGISMPTKRSFADKGVPKLELGYERSHRAACTQRKPRSFVPVSSSPLPRVPTM